MNGIVKIGKITKEQSYTAYKKGRREDEIEKGFSHKQTTKVHGSAKYYNRNREKNVDRYMELY